MLAPGRAHLGFKKPYILFEKVFESLRSCLLLLLYGLSFQVHLQKEFKNFFKQNRDTNTDQMVPVEDYMSTPFSLSKGTEVNLVLVRVLDSMKITSLRLVV
jgi:hypothetical protein